jgi:hypothetical protein
MRFARFIPALATALAGLVVVAPAASAAETMTVTAGPVNRGVIAVEALSCVRTDAAGDFGTLQLNARVLAPATSATGDYTVHIRDRVTLEPIATRVLAPGQQAFSYTWTGAGTERLPALDLTVTKFNATLGTRQQIDRVVTSGECGWIDLAAVPAPNALAIGHGAAGTSAVVHNTSKVALLTDVAFLTYEKNPTTGVSRWVNHYKRVNVPARSTAMVASPPLPCGVPLRVRTATGNRTYWGKTLSTGSTPACGATLPAEAVFVAPVPANDPYPCSNPAIQGLPDPHWVVINTAESGCFGSRINLTNYGFNLSIVVLKAGWSFSDYGSTATMVKLKVTNGTETFIYRAEDGGVRISK